jgi:hypothetical protein
MGFLRYCPGMNNKIDHEKIEQVKAMLRDPLVAQAWNIYYSMEYSKGWNSKAFLEARDRAWRTYCHYRDLYLGVKVAELDNLN